MDDRSHSKTALIIAGILAGLELIFVMFTNAWSFWHLLMIPLAAILVGFAYAIKDRSFSRFMAIAGCAAVSMAVIGSMFMLVNGANTGNFSGARSGGNYGSTMSTIAPQTQTPVTPYNPGPNVTWSTIDPQPTTEEPAPTTTRPPATTTPRTTTVPRPRTTTEDPPPAQQEAPPADQPSDSGSAFGSTGQGGDEPSSGLNDQSNSGSVEQPG